MRVVVALAVFGLLGACATTAPRATVPPSDELAELREQIAILQRRNTVTEVELQRLRVKVAELELAARSRQRAEAPREVTRPLAPSGPEVPIQPERAGVIESSDLAPPPITEEVRAAPPMARAGDPVSERTVPVRPSPERAAPPSASSERTTVSLDDAAQDLYDQGYRQYNQGEFIAAETTFQRFLQRYPATSLADNAQYWIGESRFGRGDLRGALAAFRETVSRFPEGNKAPDALLRAGRCLEGLGDPEAAIEAYRELVRRYPNSADALIAGDRIRDLGG